jgi:hypothetical protein
MAPGPNVGDNSNTLNDVSAVSASDVWAVGDYRDNSTHATRTLVTHWDGIEWSVVPSPNASTDDNTLNDVWAVSARDVWAVGNYMDPGGTTLRTLVIHWDGAEWSVVPSPNLSATFNSLNAVSALSVDDVWAVGDYRVSGASLRTLVMHWDGTSWSVVPSPNQGTMNNVLNDVSGAAPDDVWAVGFYASAGGGSGALILHWDGTSWSVVPTTYPEYARPQLYGVSAVSADEVWAAGVIHFGPSPSQSLVTRWNGTDWTDNSPSISWGTHSTTAVSALSANDVWVVGQHRADTTGTFKAMMAHWNGAHWSVWNQSIFANSAHFLNGVARMSIDQMWAVGHYLYPFNVNRTLVVHYTCTPISCTLQFPDVPPDNTFYPFVRCLACQGIIQGYSDGTFRPNDPVTRGQISKIISLSAGFAEPVPATWQTFEDVPYGSPFWAYIERLHSRNIVGGYQCGSNPAEPCIPFLNRPYFRPNSGATRGQLVKIALESAGFSGTIPPTQYTFTDVEPGHTFWLYIERLLLNRPDAISGYTCGGVGEPCDAENRPYFRPNNPLTRGQTSKIVSSTFFPGCSPPRP